MPSITIKEDITNEDAVEMKKLCPVSVFDIEDLKSSKRLFVKNEKNCVVCRACVNHDKFGSKIEVGKENNHYHFTIESVGVLPPEKVFADSLRILAQKSQFFQTFFEK